MIAPGMTHRGQRVGYFTAVLAAWLCVSGVSGQIPDDRMKGECNEPPGSSSVYNFNIHINNNGSTDTWADWDQYRGHIVMVVNVASF
jgi:hypothetical protein